MSETHFPLGSGLEDDYRPFDPVSRVKLPGHNMEECIFFDAVGFIPKYDVHPDSLIIHDPVWGDEEIDAKEGDQGVLVSLAKHPAVQRLMSVEHLTLPPSMSTIPNTSYMSTWEHIWGSAVVVRRLLGTADIDPSSRPAVVMQLRTFLSDVGKTAFGHLGDWRFQGFGSAENLHDMDLMSHIERTGIGELLEHFDFQPEDVVFPDVKDFVECDSPRVNVDRLDYTLRERRRWHMAREKVENWSGAIALKEGEIVFNNEDLAATFARGNLVLPVMHWQEPVHKLQLRLLMEMVNRISVQEMQMTFAYPDGLMNDYHPYDYMYSVDEDFMGHTFTSDEFLWSVRPIADQIGRDMRGIFLERALQDSEGVSSGRITSLDDMHYRGMPHTPPNVEIYDVTGKDPAEVVPDYQTNPYAVDVMLPGLKPRKATNPIIDMGDGELRKLMEVDPSYVELAESARRHITASHVARLLVNPDTKRIIVDGMRRNAAEMPRLLERGRMPDGVFKSAVNGNFTSNRRRVDVLWAD